MTTEESPLFERVLIFAGSGAWLLALCGQLGLLPIAGVLTLDLYRYYSFAGLFGWLSGNVYVLRRRRLKARSLLIAYLLGPAGFAALLRAFADPSSQRAAPFVLLYGFMVYLVFFSVPVTLRPERS